MTWYAIGLSVTTQNSDLQPDRTASLNSALRPEQSHCNNQQMEILIHAEGATETDLKRGVAAAQRVFESGGATAVDCAIAASQRVRVGALNNKLASLWDEAEKAAISASCERLTTIPPGACLELRLGDSTKKGSRRSSMQTRSVTA